MRGIEPISGIVYQSNLLVIKPGDLDDRAKALKGLLLDRGFCKKVSQGASQIRAEYKDRFSVERIKIVWEGAL